MYRDDCDILVQATGALNNWKWPNIPGLHDFKGKLLHSATWDEEYDYTVCAFDSVEGQMLIPRAGAACRRYWQWI